MRQVPLLTAVVALTTACAAATVSLPASPAATAGDTPAPNAALRGLQPALAGAAAAAGGLPIADEAQGRPAVIRAPQRPDLLVTSSEVLPTEVIGRLGALVPSGAAAVLRVGTLTVAGASVAAVGVDPASFRSFTPPSTATSDAVWASIARGEAAISHAAASARQVVLGSTLPMTGPRGAGSLRVGALATTGLPDVDVVVDDQVAARLGLPAATGVVLSADSGDPAALAAAARTVLGSRLGRTARIDLLSAPAASPTAFLSGSRAAKAFGAFSYRYYADGTIEPDAAWVAANIRTESMPVFGSVTCHRLMLPQLRGALQEVADAGLAGTLHTYDGCYVPRFIERDPTRSISLHTWGIAIDFDAATNYRGIRGTMDPRVVAIFKRWGFRWGGDWSYTDPMHFELGALLEQPA